MRDGALDQLRIQPGHEAKLARRDASDTLGIESKTTARELLEPLVERLRVLQNHLWAERARSVILVLQGMDASGKDGTIRRVFSGVNPQGCVVWSFKAPTHEELAHDYLWRVHTRCPERGDIGIWNRSHYEDLVTARILELIDDDEVERRARHVREFERMLVDEGARVVKVFLHISRDEQRRRLQERLDDPEKNWKFNPADLEARDRWDDYQARYDAAITATSTDWAPWFVVPADHKWVRDVAVAATLVETLEAMDPHVPPADPSLAGIVVS